MDFAVVGHVEWCEFVRVPEVPAAGAIVHAERTFEAPGGGGAVAAVQLVRLAGSATLFTALGDDEVGHRSHDALRDLGVTVEVAWRPEPQRRGIVHVDTAGERTITVIGERLGPRGDDPLAWRGFDGVYFTAGDEAALRRARESRVLVATPRGKETLIAAHERLDALVGSGNDPGEVYVPGEISPEPGLVVQTAGTEGGSWRRPDGSAGEWAATPLPGPIRDAYGCGDSFAAAVTFGLGRGDDLSDVCDLAARCGAACLTGDGPYGAQLTL